MSHRVIARVKDDSSDGESDYLRDAIDKLKVSSPELERECPNCDCIMECGPCGDIMIGRLRCTHFICMKCFTKMKYHSKCKICTRNYKKNEIRIQYLK